MEFHRCWDPGDGTFIQGPFHPRHGVVAVLAPNDQLADQGVVEGRDVIARVDVAIDAYTRSAGGQPSGDPSGSGTEVMAGILGIDPAFDGMAGELDLLLADADGFTTCLLYTSDAADE